MTQVATLPPEWTRVRLRLQPVFALSSIRGHCSYRSASTAQILDAWSEGVR